MTNPIKDASEQLLTNIFTDTHQDHLIKLFSTLGEDEKHTFLDELEKVKLTEVFNIFEEALNYSNNVRNNKFLDPLKNDDITPKQNITTVVLKKYKNKGLRAIGKNELGILLVESDNTTDKLDGQFKPGLPSGKSLFQLLAEKIRRLQTLAMEVNRKEECAIKWYIMSPKDSIETHNKFFKKNNYFGLHPSDVVFFEENMLPCFDFNGKILMANKTTPLYHSDGSGGFLFTLKDNTVLDHMASNGVKYILSYSLENILAKVGDPTFLGFCINKEVDCSAKMVVKETPSEPIGTFCLMHGKLTILPYEEVNTEILFTKTDDEGLTFKGGNISSYFFKLDFIEAVVKKSLNYLDLHAVKMKLQYLNLKSKQCSYTNCSAITLRHYLHDVFRLSINFSIWEVPRESEYHALKNTNNPKKYMKSKPLDDYYKLNLYYVEKAGGFVLGKEVEISPLVTYEGEGLEDICRGAEMEAPVVLQSEEEHVNLNKRLSKQESLSKFKKKKKKKKKDDNIVEE